MKLPDGRSLAVEDGILIEPAAGTVVSSFGSPVYRPKDSSTGIVSARRPLLPSP